MTAIIIDTTWLDIRVLYMSKKDLPFSAATKVPCEFGTMYNDCSGPVPPNNFGLFSMCNQMFSAVQSIHKRTKR
jgi:hypothetical protein